MRLTVAGTTIEYEDQGSGEPVLLIHGFPLDHSLWRSQLTDLRGSARVIAPDLRGFGGSGEPSDMMAMDDYAADLKALIDDLGITQVVLCGLSMGGYIALAFLDRYPQLVKGLVLANTRAGSDDAQARQGRYATAQRVLDEGTAVVADTMLSKMLTDATRASDTPLTSFVHTMMATQRPAGVAAALRGMAERPDRTEWITSIRAPTLVITAAQDTLIPVRESESMASAIPGSTLVVIPSAAHLSCLENPDAFNTAVREFLANMK